MTTLRPELRHALVCLLLLVACRSYRPIPEPSSERPEPVGASGGTRGSGGAAPAGAGRAPVAGVDAAPVGEVGVVGMEVGRLEVGGPEVGGSEVGGEVGALGIGPKTVDSGPVVTPSACGTHRPDVGKINGADGLAIDADGTIYFTQLLDEWEYVGRWRPTESAPEPRFVRIARGYTLWGLAVDSAARRLYAASASARAIYEIDLRAAAPVPRALALGLSTPNDVAVGPDGAVYFSEQGDRKIYRLIPGSPPTAVSISALVHPGAADSGPAALAFGPGGDLFVGLSWAGNILRLSLDRGLERTRARFGAFENWGNGLAFDQAGRLYVSVFKWQGKERLLRYDATGTTAEVLIDSGAFSSLAFGRGALSCHDLYVADTGGPLRRVTVDVPGLPVP